MRVRFYLLFLGILSLLLSSCEKNDDNIFSFNSTDTVLSNGEINSFIYRGLNSFYLFKDEAPDLADGRFTNNEELNSFLLRGGRPENFFERLTVSNDRFSFIISNFEILERFFQGISIDNGLKFNIESINNSTNRYIVVTDVVKNSPADIAGIKRGMFFNRINGIPLTSNNTSFLLRSNSFTLGQAEFENNILINLSSEINLNKIQLTENPIAVSKVITEGAHKIGYLQYNGFVYEFEEQLNNEFAKFKSENVTDFVLDLRYNGGGAIVTANALCSMITGQFAGEVFSKRQWNNQIQQSIENRNPERLIDNFVTTTDENKIALNSLGLEKLYVITSKERTASASELVINSLSAYINVVVIGDPRGTVGKSQASNTFYDSPTFIKDQNLNPAHKYVIQPLIFRTVNKDNGIVANSGIQPTPNFELIEDSRNLGILGDRNEPLLKIAIDDITGNITAPSAKQLNNNRNYIGNESMLSPVYQRMYVND